VDTGKKVRKNQKLGKHKEDDGDEATGAAVAEIVVDDITPASVSEGAEVTEIVVDEAAPATVEQEVIDMQVEEGIVEATAPAVEPTEPACEQAMYCTHASVWSVELWASAAAMCCAPSSLMELFPSLYAHACERRTIQRTCIAYDARSRARNTSVRRSAEAHRGIVQGYARFGALLTSVLPYACAAVDCVVSISCARRIKFLHFNYHIQYRTHYRTHAHRLRSALGVLRARPTHQRIAV
jgi:hypothetical protein